MPQPAGNTRAAESAVAAFEEATREWSRAVAATVGMDDAARLRALDRTLDDIMARLDVDIRAWVSGDLPDLWIAGAAVAVGATVAAAAASWGTAETIIGMASGGAASGAAASATTGGTATGLQTFVNRSYTDLLSATTHVTDETKRMLRRLAREGALATLDGQTATDMGQRLTNLVQEAKRRMMTVTYSNGAVHSLADWADTAIRTQTGLAYNAGTFGACHEFDIGWVELADGPACGLTDHDDPELADGLVVPLHVAEEYPLAHPRCARAILPRGDINGKGDATGWNDSRDMDALQERALAERQRAARSTVTGRRMTVRSERSRVERRTRTARPVRA